MLYCRVPARRVSNEPPGQRQDTGPGILWSVHRWTKRTNRTLDSPFFTKTGWAWHVTIYWPASAWTVLFMPDRHIPLMIQLRSSLHLLVCYWLWVGGADLTRSGTQGAGEGWSYSWCSMAIKAIQWLKIANKCAGFILAIFCWTEMTQFVRFCTDCRHSGAKKSPQKGRNPPIGGKKHTPWIRDWLYNITLRMVAVHLLAE